MFIELPVTNPPNPVVHILGNKSEAIPPLNKNELLALKSSGYIMINSPSTNESWFGALLSGMETDAELRKMRHVLEFDQNMLPEDIKIYSVNLLQ